MARRWSFDRRSVRPRRAEWEVGQLVFVAKPNGKCILCRLVAVTDAALIAEDIPVLDVQLDGGLNGD